MAEKKSFVLYTEYEENLQELPDEELGQLFRAIFGYVNRGVVPELSPSSKMAFSFIRKDLDRTGKIPGLQIAAHRFRTFLNIVC